MLPECFGNREPPFHVHRGLGEDALVRRVFDDGAGDLEPAEHLDAAF